MEGLAAFVAGIIMAAVTVQGLRGSGGPPAVHYLLLALLAAALLTHTMAAGEGAVRWILMASVPAAIVLFFTTVRIVRPGRQQHPWSRSRHRPGPGFLALVTLLDMAIMLRFGGDDTGSALALHVLAVEAVLLTLVAALLSSRSLRPAHTESAL